MRRRAALSVTDLWINGRSWTYQHPPPKIRSDDSAMIITPGAILGKVCRVLLHRIGSGLITHPYRQRRISRNGTAIPSHRNSRPSQQGSAENQTSPFSDHHSPPNHIGNANTLPPIAHGTDGLPPRPEHVKDLRTYSSTTSRRGNGARRAQRVARHSAEKSR